MWVLPNCIIASILRANWKLLACRLFSSTLLLHWRTQMTTFWSPLCWTTKLQSKPLKRYVRSSDRQRAPRRDARTAWSSPSVQHLQFYMFPCRQMNGKSRQCLLLHRHLRCWSTLSRTYELRLKSSVLAKLLKILPASESTLPYKTRNTLLDCFCYSSFSAVNVVTGLLVFLTIQLKMNSLVRCPLNLICSPLLKYNRVGNPWMEYFSLIELWASQSILATRAVSNKWYRWHLHYTVRQPPQCKWGLASCNGRTFVKLNGTKGHRTQSWSEETPWG